MDAIRLAKDNEWLKGSSFNKHKPSWLASSPVIMSPVNNNWDATVWYVLDHKRKYIMVEERRSM